MRINPGATMTDRVQRGVEAGGEKPRPERGRSARPGSGQGAVAPLCLPRRTWRSTGAVSGLRCGSLRHWRDRADGWRRQPGAVTDALPRSARFHRATGKAGRAQAHRRRGLAASGNDRDLRSRAASAQGPALLFENPRGSRVPVLCNLFGTPKRVAMGMGEESVDALKEVGKLLAYLRSPSRPRGSRMSGTNCRC